MCFGTASAPKAAAIAAAPKPSMAPFQIERTKERLETAAGDRTRGDIRKFDLGLPASFQIPS